MLFRDRSRFRDSFLGLVALGRFSKHLVDLPLLFLSDVCLALFHGIAPHK